MPITKAFDRDVGIIDMHVGDMLWAVSGKYLDILSSLVFLTLQISTLITCVTLVHFYEVLLKYLHVCRRYAPDKNHMPNRAPPARGENYYTTRFSKWAYLKRKDFTKICAKHFKTKTT
jgi:hypothetical protein